MNVAQHLSGFLGIQQCLKIGGLSCVWERDYDRGVVLWQLIYLLSVSQREQASQ